MSTVSRRLEVHRPVEPPEIEAPALARALRPEGRRDCRLCKREHALRRCTKFRKMDVDERWRTVRKFKYCFNCLAHSHTRNKCTSRERCRECRSEHHSLLHRSKDRKKSSTYTSASGDLRPHNAQSGRRRQRGRGSPNNSGAARCGNLQCCLHHQQLQPQQPQHHLPQQQLPQQQLPQQFCAVPGTTPATIVINVLSGRSA